MNGAADHYEVTGTGFPSSGQPSAAMACHLEELSPNHAIFHWKVEWFFDRSALPLYSPVFGIGDDIWELQFWPKGQDCCEDRDFVSAYLRHLDGPPTTISFSISLTGRSGTKLTLSKDATFNASNYSCGFDKFTHRRLLEDSEEQFCDEDELDVEVEIKYFQDDVSSLSDEGTRASPPPNRSEASSSLHSEVENCVSERAVSAMFFGDIMLHDMEDPLEDNPRYEKIRKACCEKDNVQIALDRVTNKTVAIKLFRRGPSIRDNVRREILNHAGLQHVNVVYLYHVFLTSNYLCISLELGQHNLWEYVHGCGGRLAESEAQSIFVQLIDGVHYCHSQGVANRDIKMENCLVNTVHNRGMTYIVLKICDFGYCKNVEKDSLPKSLVGTAAYLSPEVLDRDPRGYDAMLVDVWACGVVLYYLLEGRFPFGTEETNGGMSHLRQRILHLDYELSAAVSPTVQDLLSRIFCQPELRIDLETVRDHWWVRTGYKRDDVKVLGKLHREGSTANMDRQSMEEMKELITEACLPSPEMESELDAYLP